MLCYDKSQKILLNAARGPLIKLFDGDKPLGRCEIEFSLTTPPPGRSEGPGPLRRKQKQTVF